MIQSKFSPLRTPSVCNHCRTRPAMPPTSDGESVRTVGCALEKLVPDANHLQKVQHAVASNHKATILASELLNMHIRRVLNADARADLSCCFTANWLLNAYNEVTVGKRKVKVNTELRATRDACMPRFFPPDRMGITECLLYDARNLATVAATNVWMHFSKRVLSHVQMKFALPSHPPTVLRAWKRARTSRRDLFSSSLRWLRKAHRALPRERYSVDKHSLGFR